MAEDEPEYVHASGEESGSCSACVMEQQMDLDGYPFACSGAEADPNEAGVCAWCGHTIEVRPQVPA